MNSFKAVCLLAVLVLTLLNQRCIGAEEIKTPDPNAKENLIDNGSFESDAIKPWVVFGGPGKSPEASLVQQQRIRKFFALIQPENPAHAIFFKKNIFFALVFSVSNIISIVIYNI